jgi:hypothetical protein
MDEMRRNEWGCIHFWSMRIRWIRHRRIDCRSVCSNHSISHSLSSYSLSFFSFYSFIISWSARYGGEEEKKDHRRRRRRHLHEDDRNKQQQDEGKCNQAGGEGDGNWYRGMGECYGSNVAYSLFGVLKTDKSSLGRNPCTRTTFINSFYTTDGLQSFTPAGGVSDSSISQTCTKQDNGETSVTLGCSAEAQFQIDEFGGGGCIGAYYQETLDPLEELNAALTKNMQCRLIYKGDGSVVNYATEILSNSRACTTEGNQKDFCPDPFGMLSAYQYNFVMAQQNSNYTVVLASGREGHAKARKLLGCVLLVAGSVMLALTMHKWRRSYVSRRRGQEPELMASPDYVLT